MSVVSADARIFGGHVGRAEAIRCRVLQRHLVLQGTGQAADAAAAATIAGVVMYKAANWRSPSELAVGLMLAMLPTILSLPIAWRVADAHRRVLTLAWAQLARAVICAAGLLVLVTDSRTVGFAVIGVMTAAQAVTGSLRSAALPRAVHGSRLVAASSLCALTGKVAGTIGAATALGLSLVQPGIVFVAAAAAHVVSSIGYLSWHIDLGGRATASEPAPDLQRAWHQLCHRRSAVRAAVLAVGGRCLLGATAMLFAIHADRRFGLGPAGYAAAIGLCASGVFCGAAFGPSWMRRTAGRAWARNLGRCVVVVALVAAMVPTLVTSALVVFLLSTLFGVLRLQADAAVLSVIDDVDRGRFFATYDASYQLAFLVGAVGAAVSPLPSRVDGLAVLAAVTSLIVLLPHISFLRSRRSNVC
jgi:hypothetical protein